MTAIPQLRVDYYTDYSAVSRSMAEVAIESPLLYRKQFIDCTYSPKQTWDMEFGQVVHLAAFEPTSLPHRIAVSKPGVNKRTKAFQEWKAANEGKHILDAEDFAILGGITRGIAENRHADKLITAPGIAEKPIRWTDKETGLPRKAKPDKVFLGRRLIIDLKTAPSACPDTFARTAPKWGLHRQAAWYLDGCREVYGRAFEFLFVVCQKVEPFEVTIVRLDEEAINLGRKQNKEIIAEIKHRLDTGDWSSRWSGINTVQLPKWETRELYESAASNQW